MCFPEGSMASRAQKSSRLALADSTVQHPILNEVLSDVNCLSTRKPEVRRVTRRGDIVELAPIGLIVVASLSPRKLV